MYVVTADDRGHNIKLRVGFNDDNGYWETVTSDAIGQIE